MFSISFAIFFARCEALSLFARYLQCSRSLLEALLRYIVLPSCLCLIYSQFVFGANNQISQPVTLLNSTSDAQSTFNFFKSANNHESSAIPPALTVLGLYVQGAGGNTTEAKINAHELAMRRAILLLIDKLGIAQNAINQTALTYELLKTVFTPINIELEQSANNSYSALVDYQYKLDTFCNVIYNNSNASVQDMFYEYAVIPIIKRGAMLHIADNSTDSHIKWDKYWMMANNVLEGQKLLIMFSSSFPQGFSAQNVLNATYNDVLQAFYPKLIKGIIFVVIEYFTDFTNGATSLKSSYKIQEFDEQIKNFEQTFSLSSTFDDVTVANSIMHYLIENYGASTKDSDSKEDAYSTLDIIFNNDLKTEIAKNNIHNLRIQNPQEIRLFVNLQTAEELQAIQTILLSIHFVKKIEVELGKKASQNWHNGVNYCITITVNGDKGQLVEELYNFRWSMEKIDEESFNLSKIDGAGV